VIAGTEGAQGVYVVYVVYIIVTKGQDAGSERGWDELRCATTGGEQNE
jgi:hypothetical protein